MDLGQFILGVEIPLTVQTLNGSEVATAPTSVPTANVYTEAGTFVVTTGLPPLNTGVVTGLFGFMLPLTSVFSTGRHVVRYNYTVSGSEYADWDSFEIVGGGSVYGTPVSQFFLSRPDMKDFILEQVSSGYLGIRRGPRV